jgi:protoheme IX farnesyltransferase
MKTEQAVLYDKPHAREASHSKFGDIFILAKVRVNALVVATTAGGYYMASTDPIDPIRMAAACAGTALVASGAAAFNQVTERDTDRLMDRTRHRPLADRRMTVAEGLAVAGALSAGGLLLLGLATNAAATWVALATLLIYALVYTPLKRHTSLATVIGAVPGALPPLIGWAAAGGSLSVAAPWALFAIMFLWQLPHFLAIAWIYRADYARAGLPMLPVVDPHGGVTGRQATLWAASLVPFSLPPYLLGLADGRYAVGAIVLGIIQLVVAFRFAAHRSEVNARTLFYASIVYLPLLWLLLAFGRR